MKTLNVIDGTNTKKAPPPRRRGWTTSLYNVIDANRGWSNTDEIRELLPAELDSHQIISDDDLRKRLGIAVYQGYLIERDGRYNIAPYSYWEKRQDELRERRNNPVPRRRRRPKDAPLAYLPRPMWHWLVLATVAANAFVIGLLIGIVL